LHQFLKDRGQFETKKTREPIWHFWTKKWTKRVFQSKFWHPKILAEDLPTNTNLRSCNYGLHKQWSELQYDKRKWPLLVEIGFINHLYNSLSLWDNWFTIDVFSL